jgi:hypothetical protein
MASEPYCRSVVRQGVPRAGFGFFFAA